jgi:UDP-2-acetamido-3-amino-2,3-dideoxy-glucuronate N-acetyltransferase
VASRPGNEAPYRLHEAVEFGEDVVVYAFTNLYGCRIGDRTRVGPFVEIQAGAAVGADCKIQSHTFICEGVEILDEVFVGHGVLFVNDRFPRATSDTGELQTAVDWELLRTRVERRASLGSGAIVMGGITIGEGALVGETVAGVPARALQSRRTG